MRNRATNLKELLRPRDLKWGLKYAQFLASMAAKDPAAFAREFATWNRYLFLPGLTKPPPPPPVLRCANVQEAASVFFRDGFVVLSDALTPVEAEALKQAVELKAAKVLRMDEAGELEPHPTRGPKRYSFGDFGHSPEWEYLAYNERVLPIVKSIWRGLPFRAVAAGGDFVLPGGTWQGLHSDQAWNGAGDGLPQVVTVNYYVSEVLPVSGPIRQVPGTARFPIPNRLVCTFEPAWMKQSLVTGKAGYAVIRDQRAWHGGTPNTSTEPRYMPNLEYALRKIRLADLGDTVVVQRLSRGEWIADFG